MFTVGLAGIVKQIDRVYGRLCATPSMQIALSHCGSNTGKQHHCWLLRCIADMNGPLKHFNPQALAVFFSSFALNLEPARKWAPSRPGFILHSLCVLLLLGLNILSFTVVTLRDLVCFSPCVLLPCVLKNTGHDINTNMEAPLNFLLY